MKVESISLTNEGIRAYKKHRFGTAQKKFEQAISLDPENEIAHFQLGIMYLYDLGGKLDEARSHLEKSYTLISKQEDDHKNQNKVQNAEICYHLGRVYYDMKNPDKAFSLFEEAIKYDPELSGPYFFKGLIMEDREKYNEAQHLYRKAIVLNPKYDRAYTQLGNLYMMFDQVDAAKAVFAEAIRINEENTECRNLLGMLFMREKAFKQAIKMFYEALDIDPGLTLTTFNLGMAYAESGNVDRAVHYLNKFIRMADDEQQGYIKQAQIIISHLESGMGMPVDSKVNP